MRITGQNLIAGKQSAEGKKTFKAFNPAALEALPELFFQATKEETDRALVSATEAFDEYKLVSGSKKAEFLRRRLPLFL